MIVLPQHVPLHRRLLVVAAAAALACNQPPPPAVQPAPSGPPSAAGFPSCRESLDELCRECPTYDEALASLEKDCTSSKVETSGWHGRIGACGAYRYITRGDVFIDTTYYYDAAGRLVGALSESENIHNVCRGDRQYGEAVACERQGPERIVCGR